ncbi:MAG: TlpA family protein disulfide reductase [Deltaproteobacteria bacterium]|nr:TlpA family protein disulfide reductase [Deltaproteobacteria bacterium]
MNNKVFIKGLQLIFVVSIITCLLSFPSIPEGKQADSDTLDFSLAALDGEKVSLKDYRGEKVVHLMFSATWCPKCLLEMPNLKKLYDTVGDRPYEIPAVNVGYNDSLKRIRKIKEKYQIPCKILFDEKGELSKGCAVVFVPCHIIIDKDGVIQDRFSELPADPVKYLNELFPPQKKLSTS